MSWFKEWFNTKPKNTYSADMQKLSVLTPDELSARLVKERDALVQKYKPAVSTAKLRNSVVGLENLGNSCYMNSILQCLLHTPELKDHFLRTPWWTRLNALSSLTKGELACEFALFLEKYWTQSKDEMAPSALKKVISKAKPSFSGWEQHDAQEFLCYFLDSLHEDLNEVIIKPYEPIEDFKDGMDVKSFLARVHAIHLLRNKSFIISQFHGQFYTKIICPEPDCGHKSIVGDPFDVLSLPVPNHGLAIVDFYYFPSSFDGPLRHFSIDCYYNHLMSDIEAHFRENAGEYKRQRFKIFLYERLRVASQEAVKHTLTVEAVESSPFLPILVETYNPVISDLVFGSRKEEVLKRGWDQAFKLRVQDFVNGTYNGVERMVEVPEDVTQEEIELLLYLVHRKPLMDLKLSEWAKRTDFPTTRQRAAEEYQLFKSVLDRSPPGRIQIKLFDDALVKVDPREADGRFFSVVPNRTLRVSWELFGDKEVESIKLRTKVKERLAGMPQKKNSTAKLTDCLHTFKEEEQLDKDNTWYCSKCQEHRAAFRESLINIPPASLVIHLRRFKKKLDEKGLKVSKIETEVAIPGYLDMTPYLFQQTKEWRYELYGVVNHFGNLNRGHYTAFVKSQEGGAWNYYDDEATSKAKETDVSSKAAYLLFYRLIKDGGN